MTLFLSLFASLLSVVRFALLLCFVRFALLLSLVCFVVASDYEKKGIYINFYLDAKVLEHIYPDNFIYIFIIDRYV
jgi:hypothetical protein